MALVACAVGAARVPALVPSGNQYTYFLHGLARAGVGFLQNDWLVRTADPFPAYSTLVAWAWRSVGLGVFYLWYLLFAALFGCALVGIASRVWRRSPGPVAWIGLASAVVVLNWQVPSFVVPHLWAPVVVSLNGMAGQTVLDMHFQPSTFGVLVLVGLWAVLAGRTTLGLAIMTVTPLLHVDYGFGAATFAGAVLWSEAQQRGWPTAFRLAVMPGALLTLGAGLAWWTFHPTSAAMFKQASDILFTYRIPHHAQVAVWFDRSAVFQTALVTLALVLVRRTPLAVPYVAAVAVTVGLTVLQMVTGSEALALLFPWRTSVFLVPIAAAVLVATVAERLDAWLMGWRPALGRLLAGAFAAAAIAVAIDGALVSRQNIDAFEPAWRPLTTAIQSRLQAGHTFVVPLDFEYFRDMTGAPIVIDGKSHPIRDFEIVEWFDRVRAVDALYREGDQDPCAAVALLVERYGATDLVWPAQRAWPCAGSERLYADETFAWYRLAAQGR
jgi:hypothetical protein